MAGPRPSLVLIGLRGSGKSTVGRLVAARLGVPFVDLDDLTARELGAATPGEAIRAAGEAAFRAAEARALEAELAASGRVVALGGGTPTAPGASDRLAQERDAGAIRIVYLRARPATLRARLSGTDLAARPALTPAGDPLREIDAVFAARDGAYRALASLVIDTDALAIEAIVDAVVRAAA